MRTIQFFVFLFFFISVFSQDYFNKRFEFFHPQVVDGGHNALEVEDGYIINGGTGDSLNPFWLGLGMKKFNFEGEMQWKKRWGDTISEWFYAPRGSLIKCNSAYYTIGGKRTYTEESLLDEILLIKYDNNFDTLWSALIGENNVPYDSSHIARDFECIDDGFIITGTHQTPVGSITDVMLIKTDSIGNEIWRKLYGGTEEEFYQGISVTTTTDGGYTIGGYRHIFGAYGAAIGDPILIKTDSFGNKEWELNLGGPYQDGPAKVCNSQDGNIIVASRYDVDSVYWNKYLSRIQLTKIDLQGNIIWNKLLGDKELWSWSTNIRQDSLGGYIISGSTDDTKYPIEPGKMGFALRVSGDGDSLWYRKYAVLWNKSSRNYLYDMIPTNNGGFLGAGGCSPAGYDTGTQDAWIIKVDSMGCTSITDCWVGEPEWNWITTESGNKIKVYPNPAHNWFEVEIKTDNKKDENLTIEVFDLFGRKVKEVEIPKGKKSYRFYVSDWNRSVYLIRLKSRAKILGSGKVVLE